MRLNVHLVFTLFVLLSSVACKELGAIYLPFDRRDRLVINNFAPSVVCLEEQPWFNWFLQAFEKRLIIVNATSQFVYPVHVFVAKNEVDLRSKSTWHEENSATFLSFYLNYLFPFSAVDSDRIELTDDSAVELFGFDSQCVAFIAPPGKVLYDSSNALTVRFRSSADLFRWFRIALGLILFCAAPVLSNNLAFYYASGVSLSIIGSVLIVVLLTLRLLPKRTNFILRGALLLGGSACSVLFFYLTHLRSFIWSFATKNLCPLACYVVATALISGIILYWFSIPERLIENFPRTQNLIRFCIRAVGALLIASAPQLPSEALLISSLIHFIVFLLDTWLNVDASVLLAASPLLMRVAFTFAILGLYIYVTSYNFTNSERCFNHLHTSRRSTKIPGPPCLSSTPCRELQKPVWSPPGSSYHKHSGEPSFTTSYGGYGYQGEEQDYRGSSLDPTDAVWDGDGYVFFPFQTRHTRRSLPMRQTRRSPVPLKARRCSAVGWVDVPPGEVLTDDDEDCC